MLPKQNCVEKGNRESLKVARFLTDRNKHEVDIAEWVGLERKKRIKSGNGKFEKTALAFLVPLLMISIYHPPAVIHPCQELPKTSETSQNILFVRRFFIYRGDILKLYI